MKLKKLILPIQTITLASIIIACAGESTDPLKDYQALKGVPLHNEESEKQIAYPEIPFIVSIEGASADSWGQFTVGVEGEARIRVKANNPKGKNFIELGSFELVDTPSSQTMKLEPSKEDYEIFVVKWKPTPGFTEGRSAKSLLIKGRAISKEGVSKDFNIGTFIVTTGFEVPKIDGTSIKENTVLLEGDKDYEFTVDIEDPNYIPGVNQPIVRFDQYISPDPAAFRENSSNRVSVNQNIKPNPEHLGGKKFRFYQKLNLQNMEDARTRQNKVNPNATSLVTCFNISVKSSTGIESDPSQKCVTVNYQVQLPKIEFLDKPETLAAGMEHQLRLKVSTENLFSDVELVNAANSIRGLSGTKSIEKIEGESSKSVEYVLTWKPSCSKNQIKIFSLELQAQSKVNGKTKTDKIKTDLQVVESEENCKPAQPGAKS